MQPSQPTLPVVAFDACNVAEGTYCFPRYFASHVDRPTGRSESSDANVAIDLCRQRALGAAVNALRIGLFRSAPVRAVNGCAW